jgi:hypothetical protein
MKPSPKRLVARSVEYYSEYDEDQFFGWLDVAFRLIMNLSDKQFRMLLIP